MIIQAATRRNILAFNFRRVYFAPSEVNLLIGS